jgi:polyisoprenoid-binding protein YceI
MEPTPKEQDMTAPTIQIPGYVAGKWTIDAVHSHVGFAVRHAMVSKVRGQFTKFEGEIVTGDDVLQSGVNVTVDLTSIDTSNEMRDNHIRSADFFDVEHHPNMTFASTGIRYEKEELLIDGNLTVRGITKPVTLTAEINGIGAGMQGGTVAGISATGSINRHDFNVSYNGPIPGGGVVISEKVDFLLEVEATLND